MQEIENRGGNYYQKAKKQGVGMAVSRQDGIDNIQQLVGE